MAKLSALFWPLPKAGPPASDRMHHFWSRPVAAELLAVLPYQLQSGRLLALLCCRSCFACTAMISTAACRAMANSVLIRYLRPDHVRRAWAACAIAFAVAHLWDLKFYWISVPVQWNLNWDDQVHCSFRTRHHPPSCRHSVAAAHPFRNNSWPMGYIVRRIAMMLPIMKLWLLLSLTPSALASTCP